jgi:hypothetical protein
MRRKSSDDTSAKVKSTRDIKSELTDRQLAAFGAAALAYNVLEDQIDALLAIATRIPDWLFSEVSSRVHGLDGKVAIIQVAIEHALTAEDAKDVIQSVATFGDFKKTRDTLIHARIINSLRGQGAKQRGKSPYEVLLSIDALDAFYEHVTALQTEFLCGGKLINSALALKQCAADDPNRSRIEEEFLAHKAQFRESHSHRRSLKPLPRFPDEEQLREAENRHREERIAEQVGHSPRLEVPTHAQQKQVSEVWKWLYHRNNALLDTYYPPRRSLDVVNPLPPLQSPPTQDDEKK